MNSVVNNLIQNTNFTETENEAIAHSSTQSSVLDLFALGGAYRNRSEQDCRILFGKAYAEDKENALKCLFYLRDIRGQGERRFFRICYKYLAEIDPAVALLNLYNIPIYGRWDDVIDLIDSSISYSVLTYISWQLHSDIDNFLSKKPISLLAKWLPSENASSMETKKKAKQIRKALCFSSKQYRKILSSLRGELNIVEKEMSSNNWDAIDFNKVPGKASLNYANVFSTREETKEKYSIFIEEAKKNKQLKTETLYPYEIVNKVVKTRDKQQYPIFDAYWDSQKDFLSGISDNAICVCDTSNSMTWTRENKISPITVAISLSLYCAERLNGDFKNKYISFSEEPQLVNVAGGTFSDKVNYIYKKTINARNTNLVKVFDLLFDVAKHSKKEDIPNYIIIISDMEIDDGLKTSKYNLTTVEDAFERKWKDAGLKCPKVIYWNVEARNDIILDLSSGVSYVSGCSPMLFKQILSGKSGYELMLEVIGSSRYNQIIIE